MARPSRMADPNPRAYYGKRVKWGGVVMIRILAALIVACVFSAASAAECPAGRSVPVKEGHFGAKNVRAYHTMISMHVRKHREGIRKMIEDGTVIALPTDRRACIVKDVATSYRTRVAIPGHEGTFWVHASALER